MAELSMFVTEEEVGGIIHEFAELRHLVGLAFVQNTYRPFDIADVTAVLTQKPRPTTLFLFPEAHRPTGKVTDANARPRQRGWIDVEAGRVVTKKGERVLTMTTFTTEEQKELPFRPAAWLRQLKKDLTSVLHFGVEAINVDTGRGAPYPNIAWSDGARRLHKDGVVWKQHPDYRVVFAPMQAQIEH